MKDPIDRNRELWDALVPVHLASDFYDVEGFRAGRCTLDPIEVEELGDVQGRSLLHLQCHFGLDTLSWARRGARATGMDFSAPAIEAARRLADEAGLDARFLCSEIGQVAASHRETYDIVFSSGGVLCWLPDLRPWAEAIAGWLEPGGVFYLREFHPVGGIFDDEHEGEPRLRYPYFPHAEPLVFEPDGLGSYADPDSPVDMASAEWSHPVSEILGALLGAGLRLDFFHEFDFISYKSHLFLEQGEDGRWRHPDHPGGLPLMFSLKMTKE